jgi:hypothetical protein
VDHGEPSTENGLPASKSIRRPNLFMQTPFDPKPFSSTYGVTFAKVPLERLAVSSRKH